VTETAISEALEFADMLQTFAYEQGFHECGYDPIKRLRAHIADLQSQLAAQRERDGRLCALLEAAIGPAGGDFCMNPELEADIQAAIKERP